MLIIWTPLFFSSPPLLFFSPVFGFFYPAFYHHTLRIHLPYTLYNHTFNPHTHSYPFHTLIIPSLLFILRSFILPFIILPIYCIHCNGCYYECNGYPHLTPLPHYLIIIISAPAPLHPFLWPFSLSLVQDYRN